MIGAILGDMIGAPYEFDLGDKTKDFPLFIGSSRYTDDSVMTIAVAEALMDSFGKTDDEIRNALYDTLEETRHVARLTAEVTHNHPEGIKGAEATASAIFLARTGSSKEEIKEYIIREFSYDLSRTCDEIRPEYYHIESCQETVPEAVTAFLEGNDFEDVIRTAVSLGGDCDTLTCIAGGMAEAFYGIPTDIAEEGRKRLPADMLAVIGRFGGMRKARTR